MMCDVISEGALGCMTYQSKKGRKGQWLAHKKLL